MKTFVSLTTLAAVALGLGACTPPKDAYGHWGKQAKLMNAVSRLNCPDEKGDLKRISAAADGRSCVYSGDEQSTVELRLINVTGGDAKAALAPIEAESHALVPGEANEPPAAPEAPAEPATPAAPAKPGTPSNVSMHPAGAKLPAGRSEEDVQIDLPGLHIHANDGGARVNVAGVKINADDDKNNVHIERKANGRVGGDVFIDAHDQGAVIRLDDSDANIRSRLILASKSGGPQGDRAAGYVARGPRSGPLVVAVVRVKGEYDHHDGVFDAAARLVKLNTGD